MSLTTIGPSGVDHPKVTLEEDLDAIKKTASDAVDSSASTTAVLNVQVPKIRKINGIPLTGDVALTDTVLSIYTKKVIDTKLGSIVSTGYNPVYLNGYLLDKDVTLTAGDVGSYSNPQITEKRAAFIPPTRKIANKPLSADVNVTAADINAYTKAQIDAKITGVLPTRTINKVPLATNIVLTPGDIGAPTVDEVVPRTFKVNGVVLAGSGITLSGASGSYTKAEFDALLTGYLPLTNKWGLGMRAIPQTSPESGFYTYTTGGPDGSSAGVKIVAGKGTLAFPSDLPGVWYSKDSTTFTQVRSGRAAPLPNYWAPLKDSLVIITGEGPYDSLTVNQIPVQLTTKSVSFARASTATYIGRDGTLKTAAINEPRFEKDGLLIEMQASNLVAYSPVSVVTGATPVNGWWLNFNQSKPEDMPIMTRVDADHVKVQSTKTGGTGPWVSFDNMGLVVGTTYTVSFDVQVINGALRFGFEGGKLLTIDSTTHGTMSRVNLTYTPTDVNNVTFYNTNTDGSADATSTYIIGRVQVEEGHVASSYIPTNGVATTRSADRVNIQESLNLPDKRDLTVAVTMGHWETDTQNPVLLSGGVFGFVGLGAKFVSYKPYVSGGNTFTLTSRPEGLVSMRVGAGKASVLANGVLQIQPITPGTDKTNLPNLILSSTIGSHDNNIRVMHLSNFRMWNRALTDDQMRGLS